MKYIPNPKNKNYTDYQAKAKDYTLKYSYRKNRVLVKLHQSGDKKDFSNNWIDLKHSMWKAQDKRCCLCEKKLNDIYAIDVEHFRPKAHYWWLAYEPINYYLTCAECNRQYKGSNFPLLDESKKVDYLTRKNISQKIPLLVNPTYDKPLDYFELFFKVASNSNERIVILRPKKSLDKNSFEYKKALKTIKILNLDLSRTDKDEEKVFTRHELLREFSDDLIEFAARRKLTKTRDFIAHCNEKKKEKRVKSLFKLGLMELIVNKQFDFDPIVLRNIQYEKNIL